MKRSKKDIQEILEFLRETDYDYELTSAEHNVPINGLRKWWLKYAEEFFGKEEALKHKPMKKTAVTKALNEPVSKEEQKEMDKKAKQALLDTFREKKDLALAPEILSHELSVTEANARVSTKAANIKLAILERIQGLIELVTADQLVRMLEVIDKIDTEPRNELNKKANSFLQLIQKQVIINKDKENHE